MPVNVSITSTDQTLLRQDIIEAAFGMGVWGINTTLFAMSFYVLIKQGVTTSRARGVLLALTSLMYIGACATELAYLLKFSSNIQGLGEPPVYLEPGVIYYLILIFPRINFMLSDGVVCWRAWALYPANKPARGILVLCMLGSLAALITASVMGTESLLNEIPDSGTAVSNLVYYIPLLFTNIVATALIALKFWQYRREIKVYLPSEEKQKSTSLVERILVLLTESGLLYCLFWIISMLSGVAIMGELGAAIFECVLPQLAAIYLMIVILVVSAQKSLDMNGLFPSPSSQISDMSLAFATNQASSSSNDSITTDVVVKHNGPQIGESFVEKVKRESRWNIHPERSQIGVEAV